MTSARTLSAAAVLGQLPIRTRYPRVPGATSTALGWATASTRGLKPLLRKRSAATLALASSEIEVGGASGSGLPAVGPRRTSSVQTSAGSLAPRVILVSVTPLTRVDVVLVSERLAGPRSSAVPPGWPLCASAAAGTKRQAANAAAADAPIADIRPGRLGRGRAVDFVA